MRLWPLAKSVLPDGYRPYRVAGGKIYLDITESPMMLSRVFRRYELPKRQALRWLLKPGMTFVDAGTNKGDFALAAAAAVGPKGKVLCFEPEPTNCYWIRKSIELNGYHNVVLHEVALGDANEETQLYLGKQSGWHSLVPSLPDRNRGVIPIAKKTLDSVLSETNAGRIDVMKIDVEGAELALLKGAVEALTSNGAIALLMDIHPQLGVSPKEVCNFLGNLGFSFYQMEHPYDKPLRIDGRVEELLALRR
jgi:FkbM family methyltransferase